MTLLYRAFIIFYYFGISIASLFNQKASFWIKGRKNLFHFLANTVNRDDRIIWIHASSLGEFEQGRPLIEKIKSKNPEYKIALTFFSPSGYEIRKDYSGADIVCYMPIDRKKNAKKFLDLIHPERVIFIKYEFWYYHLSECHRRGIPLYLVSANFREGQVFFRWYGKWYRNMLQLFTRIFVQNEKSQRLLNKAGITNNTVTGDTRFDRVIQVAKNAKTFPEIDRFAAGKKTLVCGSTWPPDEELLVRFIKENKDFKYIIAPHEVSPQNIKRLDRLTGRDMIRYSQLKDAQVEQFRVLIIDTIGMLSSLYQYGNLAYIGGGFGSGIHNILEAATFDIPVVFGPKYSKFTEAVELINLGGAFSIKDYAELETSFHELLKYDEKRFKAGAIAGTYVKTNEGATGKVLKITGLE